MWYLVSLVWVAFVVGIAWAYKSKKAKRDAAREQKFGQMLSELMHGRASAPAAFAAVGATMAVPATLRLTKKPRLLAPGNVLIYYMLRAGLPDHEIFVNVPIHDLIESAELGYEARKKMQQLAAARAHFIVCNKQFEIIAAVLMNRVAVAETRLVEECLRAAGVRLLRIDPAAPPKHTQVRALVYGET